VSHLKERKEKTCLNCQTNPLYGRYCHVCGQQNLEPKETVWHLVQHFFEDVTHFDGKFFSTVKYLMKKPGFLSAEYIIGRRASYLNPIRMYVFTSAIFFLILFSFRSSMRVATVNFDSPETGEVKNQMEIAGIPKSDLVIQNHSGWHPDRFASVEAYDSFQHRLPEGLRDPWIKRRLMERLVAANMEYRKDSRSYNEHLVENFLHSFPKILFFSLPFFALILRLLYVRRKQYFYVDHGIFTIHLYCATFILMLICVLLGQLSNLVKEEWAEILSEILILGVIAYMFIYLFRAMRIFYRQNWGKTFLKYVLLGSMALLINLTLLLVFLLVSVISI
jgi:magnesium-transporting ATPase (P-type)